MKEFLYLAIFIPQGGDPFPRELLNAPMVTKAYEKWGRDGDTALVVLNNKTKEIIGAAWVRLFKTSDPSYGFIDEETPDMAIAIKAEYRNCGIGTELLNKLIITIKNNGFLQMSLSVDPRNSALHLYKRLGFELFKAERDDNHIYSLKF